MRNNQKILLERGDSWVSRGCLQTSLWQCGKSLTIIWTYTLNFANFIYLVLHHHTALYSMSCAVFYPPWINLSYSKKGKLDMSSENPPIISLNFQENEWKNQKSQESGRRGSRNSFSYFETDGNLSNFLTIINGLKYKAGVIDVISFPA